MLLLQSFTVPFSADNSETAMHLAKVRLFIKKLDTNASIKVSVYNFERGTKSSSPLGVSIQSVTARNQTYAQAVGAITSTTGPTDFTFNDGRPVLLKQGVKYILEIDCSISVQLFSAKVGETSERTGALITSNVLTDGSFFSVNSNNGNLTSANGEDLMFELYTRSYNTSGSAVLQAKPRRIIKVSSFTAEPIWGTKIRLQENAFAAHIGTIVGYDPTSRYLFINPEPSFPGAMTPGIILNMVTSSTTIQPYGTAVVEELVSSVPYDGASVRTQNEIYDSTSIGLSFVKNAATETVAYPIENGRNLFFSSAGSYQPASATSLKLRVDLRTYNQYATPSLNYNASLVSLLSSRTSANPVDEDTDYGTAVSKYISRTVTLAEGQDAEDLRVFLTAYRPAGTDLHVYAKLWSGSDEELFDSKPWTRLTMITDENLFSSTVGGAQNLDMKEYVYQVPEYNSDLESIPTLSGSYPQRSGAFRDVSDPTEPGVVQYKNKLTSSGTTNQYFRFKQFAVKIVFVSETSTVVPLVDDIRAIAVQL